MGARKSVALSALHTLPQVGQVVDAQTAFYTAVSNSCVRQKAPLHCLEIPPCLESQELVVRPWLAVFRKLQYADEQQQLRVEEYPQS